MPVQRQHLCYFSLMAHFLANTTQEEQDAFMAQLLGLNDHHTTTVNTPTSTHSPYTRPHKTSRKNEHKDDHKDDHKDSHTDGDDGDENGDEDIDYDIDYDIDDEILKVIEQSKHNVLQQYTELDDEIMKVIEQSKHIASREDMELERAIKESEQISRNVELAKRKRPQYKGNSSNVTKMLRYDYQDINEADYIEVTLNGKLEQFPIHVELVNNNILVWRVTMETGKHWFGTMEWELEFPNDYPVKAPKVRVIRPYFQYMTGHVTVGGAICNPLLVSGQGWNTETETMSLIISLVISMVDTDKPAIVSKQPANGVSYSSANAEAARGRYYQTHGWTR
jgi:ubiquitin-protein ligase